jgi:diguanylate cyclase (GGDEF)-like protein
MFLDRLALDLLKSQRSRSRIAILFIDLDHFKEVNDTLGHHQGDVLLIDAARRISACVRKSDTVARLGGDEFTVILSDLDSTERWSASRRTSSTACASRSRWGRSKLCVGQYRHHPVSRRCDDIDDLLKHADQAMYAAKGAGRNRYSYFTPALQVEALTRMRLTNDLRNAVKEGQLSCTSSPSCT